MTRRTKVWLAVAVLFSLANLGGAIQAAARMEMIHSGVHVALTLVGACLAWWLAPRRPPRGLPRDVAERLTQLERSVDAVAIEVERIGEGQRFMTRVFTEKGTQRAPGDGAVDEGEVENRAAAPRDARP